MGANAPLKSGGNALSKGMIPQNSNTVNQILQKTLKLILPSVTPPTEHCLPRYLILNGVCFLPLKTQKVLENQGLLILMKHLLSQI